MNGRKVKDVFVSCKCFSTFSEKPWLKLFEGHEMAFFYAAKVLFSLYEKKKSFLSETFFYTCEMVLPFWTFFASSNESVSCLAVCWVVHSSKREEILFINHQIKFLEISTVKVKRWWDKGVSEANLMTPYEVLLRLNRHTKRCVKHIYN